MKLSFNQAVSGKKSATLLFILVTGFCHGEIILMKLKLHLSQWQVIVLSKIFLTIFYIPD